jgi:hypothetical protein
VDVKKRILVLLRVHNIDYKFLSIIRKKSGFYLHDHIARESVPLSIAEPFHMLRPSGEFNVKGLRRHLVEGGHQAHLSIHPARLYLKKRSAGGKEEHLMDEVVPQRFSVHGHRLHCVWTPAPVRYLTPYNLHSQKSNEELITFEWNSSQCPQLSIYELKNNFRPSVVQHGLPPAAQVWITEFGGVHPSLLLHLKPTQGDPNAWLPSCSIFGNIINRKPISKRQLQRIIDYNGVNFDVSSLPDNALIQDFSVGPK